MIIISEIIIGFSCFMLGWLRKRGIVSEGKFKQMIIFLSVMFTSIIYSLDASLIDLGEMLDVSGGIMTLSVFIFMHVALENKEKAEELQDYVLILVLQFLIITNYAWRFL